MLYGVATNDLGRGECSYMHNRRQVVAKFYATWKRMLYRCYDAEFLKDNPTYIGCSVCDDWLTLSNFREWFNNTYIDGYDLDKDMLVSGNKIYSPETCVWLPHELNALLCVRTRNKGNLPVGVSLQRSGRYQSGATQHGKRVQFGTYDTPDEAHEVYIEHKIAYTKLVVNDCLDNGMINEMVADCIFRRLDEQIGEDHG